MNSSPLSRPTEEQSEGLHTNAVAIFHLYRIAPRTHDVAAGAIEEEVMAIPSVLSVHVDLDADRLIVLYRQTDGLEQIERIVRQHGYSTAPHEAAEMARVWQEFLRSQEMTDQ
jgi:hypothetical protein